MSVLSVLCPSLPVLSLVSPTFLFFSFCSLYLPLLSLYPPHPQDYPLAVRPVPYLGFPSVSFIRSDYRALRPSLFLVVLVGPSFDLHRHCYHCPVPRFLFFSASFQVLGRSGSTSVSVRSWSTPHTPPLVATRPRLLPLGVQG